MQNTDTLYSIQLLRFIASILVLLLHLELMKSGYKGVDIFFVISGFVMHYISFVLKPKNAAVFFINRITKIFILYWLAMLLLYMVVPYKTSVSLVKTFLLIPGHASLIGVSWSLSYELYFYFLFGTTVYFIPAKYHKYVFGLFFLITSCITFLNTTHLSIKGSVFNFMFGQNLWEFLLGILSSVICHKVYTKINPKVALVSALLSLLTILSVNLSDMNLYSYIIYGTLSFCMVASVTVYEHQISINKPLSGLFKLLGDASYAIYLFGPVVTSAVVHNNYYSKISIIVMTVFISVFINRFAENSLLKMSRKYLYRVVDSTQQ